MKKSRVVLSLLLAFLKIGAFTFGGGYAMIALLEAEFVTKRGWLDRDEFLDIVAIAESTPGPIAINCATYIGYKNAGLIGSAAATVGVVLPSFCVLYAISLFFDAFLSLTYVAYAFRGIQVCVVWLILSAGLKMLKSVKHTPMHIVIFSVTVLSMLLTSLFAVRFSTVLWILLCGFVGLFAYLIGKLRKEKEERK